VRNLVRHVFFHNMGLKIIALLIAFGLWMAIAREPMAEVVLQTPIEFIHVPENLELVSDVPLQAQVRVRGPGRLVRQLVPSEVRPIVDLTGTNPGTTTIDLTSSNIPVPRNIRVLQVIPAQLRISFDRQLTRQVPVHPRVSATGLKIVQTRTDPEMVTIIGPEERVKAIENALTDPIDATGVIGSQTFSANAYVADPLVRLVKPTRVQVTVLTGR